MGINSSKSASVALKTPEKKSTATTNEQSPTSDVSPSTKSSSPSPKQKKILDPKTPAIPQTPLTQTIASHLNKIATDDPNQNPAIKTPSYLLRKKILYDLGYTYSIQDTDPRSPSQSIPRTPLNLAETETINESVVGSFQYNSSLEDSCRDFNAKLDDITMDENEINEQNTPSDDDVETNKTDDKKNENTEPKEELCEQKTPSAESGQPEFKTKIDKDFEAKLIIDENKDENDSIEKKSTDKVKQIDSMYSTPVTKKSDRAGRLPLHQLNRRGMSTEVTPINDSGMLSVEKHRKDLSFQSHDENRSSARKSKIPVFKNATHKQIRSKIYDLFSEFD